MTTSTPEKSLADKRPEAVVTMQNLIEKYKPHMARLLGKNMDVEQIFQIAILALGRQPKLLECTGASVLGCVLESARLKLQPGAGAGETWLIPFKNKYTNRMECQLVIDHRGLVKLMKRGADVGAVLAESVCSNDEFGYGVDGGKMFLDWKPSNGDRGAIIGYVAATWDRSEKLTAVAYKTIEQIEKDHRARSMAKDSGPWKIKGSGDYDGMCKKTMLRLVSKLNPAEDIDRAVALDERADIGKAQDLALLADPAAKATPDDAEEKPSYEMPKMTTTATVQDKEEPQGNKKESPDAPDHVTVGIHSISKTELDGEPVSVIRTEPDQAKFYTGSEGVAEFATKALRAGKKVVIRTETKDGKNWIIEIFSPVAK